MSCLLLELSQILNPGVPDDELPPIMALGVFCDESENHGPHLFTLAGWAAVPTAWKDFTLAWREMLKCCGQVEARAFHMVDLASLRPRSGEFQKWHRSERRRLIRRATEILLNEKLMAIPFAVAATIEVDVIKKYVPRWQPTEKDLYVICFKSLMWQVINHGVEESISFVMDEKKAVEADVVKYFYLAKQTLNAGAEDGKLRGIAFEDDRVLIQLQAADYLAYSVRRGILTKRTTVKQHREREEYERLRNRPHFFRCYGERFVTNLATAMAARPEVAPEELWFTVDAPED